MPKLTTECSIVRATLGRGLVVLQVATVALGLDIAMAEERPREDGPTTVVAQAAAGDIKLEVPGVILASPASEIALPISLAAGSTAPPQSFVRIRGLPPTAALSEGHAIQPGAWAVPLSALKGLRLVVPTGVSGKREVTVALVTLEGTTIAEARTSLVVAAAGLIAPSPKPQAGEPAPVAQAVPTPPPKDLSPPAPVTARPAPPPPVAAPAPQPAPVAAAPTPPQPAAPPPPKALPKATLVTPVPPAMPAKPPPVLSPEARQRAESYQAKGRSLLSNGDIASARLYFQRAADEGLAEAALSMGATFDPRELTQLKAHGLRPDPGEARRWYERAAELGSGEALDRLKRLGAR